MPRQIQQSEILNRSICNSKRSECDGKNNNPCKILRNKNIDKRAWLIGGNSQSDLLPTPGTNLYKIGTKTPLPSNEGLQIITSNIPRVNIHGTGKVVIADGMIEQKEIPVEKRVHTIQCDKQTYTFIDIYLSQPSNAYTLILDPNDGTMTEDGFNVYINNIFLGSPSGIIPIELGISNYDYTLNIIAPGIEQDTNIFFVQPNTPCIGNIQQTRLLISWTYGPYIIPNGGNGIFSWRVKSLTHTMINNIIYDDSSV